MERLLNDSFDALSVGNNIIALCSLTSYKILFVVVRFFVQIRTAYDVNFLKIHYEDF